MGTPPREGNGNGWVHVNFLTSGALVGALGPPRPLGTPPEEGNGNGWVHVIFPTSGALVDALGPPRPSGIPPGEGNGNGWVHVIFLLRRGARKGGVVHFPPSEGCPQGRGGHSPPSEGWEAQPDGVVQGVPPPLRSLVVSTSENAPLSLRRVAREPAQSPHKYHYDQMRNWQIGGTLGRQPKEQISRRFFGQSPGAGRPLQIHRR